MSNIIKLKRGSGSDPSASDLVVGEVALRTDSGTLFTKKDDGNITEIGAAAGVSDGDKGDITVSNSGSTFSIDSGVIDNANIASNAAIAGSKISPIFSSNISTTGNIAAYGGQLTLENGNEEQIHRFWSSSSDSDIYNLLSNITSSTFGTIVETANNGHHIIGLRDNDANDSFAIISGNGDFQTNSTYDKIIARFKANGEVIIGGNTDFGDGIDVTGDINCTSDLILDSTNTDYPRIELHSNATGIRKYGIINGQGWNQDALLIYDLDADQTRLTIEPNGLGINRGANSLSHGLDVGGTAIIRGNTEIRGNILLSGTATTTNQARTIDFTGFDKESTSDFSDRAYIQHTTNTGGLSGSVLVISSRNDASDGINFDTASNTNVRINGNIVWNAANDGSGSGLDADLLDGQQGSYYRNASNLNAGTIPAARVPTLNQDTTGNADTATTSTRVTITDQSSDTTCFPVFVQAATGDLTPHSGSNLTFNSSTGALVATSFSGNGASLTNVNATTLDSIDSGSFLRSDANDTATGAIQFTSTGLALSGHWYSRFYSGTQNYIHLYPGGHSGNASTTDIRAWTGSTFKVLRINGGSNDITWGGSKIWTAANDGNGSGLDADTVDGIEGASFVRSDADDTATGELTFSGGISTNGKDVYTNNGAFITNDPDSHFGSRSGNNIDHIWHSDASADGMGGTWHFCSDTTYKNNGNSRVYAGFFSRAGNKVWDQGNDGSGSGLDADTLDGVQGSSFLRSDANDTASGQITLSNSSQYPLVIDGANNAKFVMQGSDNPYIRFRNSADTDKGYVQYNTSDGNVMYVWNSHHGQGIQIGSSFKFYHGSAFRTVWHENNDGSGSGLDADTVDGLHSSSFLGATATAVEAFALDIDDTRNDGTRVPNDYADHKVTAEFSNQIASLGAWWAALTVKGWHDGYAPWQLIGHASTGQNINLYARFGHGSNNTFSSLYKIWHEGVDGSGSGLDADTVDGLHSSSFVRNNNNNGHILQFGSGTNTGNTASSYAYAIFQEGGAWSHPYPDLRINYHTGIILAANVSYGGVRFQKDYNDTTELFSVGNGDNHVRVANTLYIGGNTAFHAGNDGSGSGLDADTLDGTQANALIRGGAQSSVSGWHISAYRNGSGTSPHIYFSHNGGYGQHINTYNTSDSVYNLELHNNSKQLFVVYNSGRCIHGGNVLPAVGNTYDLGSSGARWQNLYVNDMHFSNEGKTNDVDGSWGDWTLQEGENDIFMINNRSGKKFKIAMIPV